MRYSNIRTTHDMTSCIHREGSKNRKGGRGEVSYLGLAILSDLFPISALSHSILRGYSIRSNYPTNRLTILEPRIQEIGELCVVQKRHGTDFESPKL